MAFDLSFSEEFFFAPGDTEGAPFDRGNPVSLYQAICVFSESEEWPEFYKSLFEMEFISPLTEGEVFRVMELARETNTCTTLSPPVEVWLDEDGDHRVSVYEERSEDNE